MTRNKDFESQFADFDRLTPERLFSDPPLSAGTPGKLSFGPAGTINYLRAADDDLERLDLWEIKDGKHRCLVDARQIVATNTDVTKLTPAERAERERRRMFNHGITEFSWHPDKQRLLIPMDGQAYLVKPDMPETQALQVDAICPTETRQSAFTLSPGGAYLSYVRQGNLYITQIDSKQETRVTRDASETITNGIPDFLAAEEMHRFEGHWWSGDDRFVAYTKTDEAPVAVSYRLELDADGARTIPQRYPYPGQINPTVELWLYDREAQTNTRIWHELEDECYLARVCWNQTQLLIQVQDRRQQTLRYLTFDMVESVWSLLFADHSETWVNLTDDFRVTPAGDYLVTSEQSGHRKILLLNAAGQTKQLQGPTHINQVLACIGESVYASGWDVDPTQNHLYRMSLNGTAGENAVDFEQVTESPGWHEITLDDASNAFLDRHSSSTEPLQVTLNELSGESQQTLYRQSFTPDHPYHPYLQTHCYPTFGQVTATDGQWVHWRMTPPIQVAHGTQSESERAPVLVYVYGGPGAQKVKQEWSPLLVQLFAHHGFGVLEIDNRGSGNRGGTFEAPLYKRMGGPEVEDQSLALQIVADINWADPQRMGVFGHSYGGYMTLMCLCQKPDVFKAGVAVAPVCDWQLYDSHYTERFMSLPADNPSGYASGNVLAHLEHLKAPLLLMHGMADDNVLFTHSTMIMNQLQVLGKPFELMTYPGAKHSMQERHVSIHRFDTILNFLKRHL
ncbi:MAG: alpha/beta fold hydrolase [Pseudomonadota bacterium]